MMDISPLIIQFVLACHVAPDPKKYLGVRVWNSTACKDIRQRLLSEGVIDDAESPKLTPMGTAWVGFICSTPFPKSVTQWALPNQQ
jgi:hypothetical protein